MLIVDTNIILRYVLNDHKEYSIEAKDIILNNDILLLTQVIAEVIYVLKGVYKSTREEIAKVLLSVCEMDNVKLEHNDIVICAITEFGKNNLDFVDILLYSYKKFSENDIVTFDKKLIAKLNELK